MGFYPVPKSQLGTCTCCPGDLGGFRVRAGGARRGEGRRADPSTCASTLLRTGAWRDAPWAQTCSALSTRGCRWLQRVLGVQGKEGQTHYVTLRLFYVFFFRLRYTGVASAFVLTLSLFNSVCSREDFFPPTLLYKMNVSALNYKKNLPPFPQENTEQLVSLNSFYPKFQTTQTGGRR